MNAIIAAIAVFLLFACCGAWTAIQFIRKSYKSTKAFGQPRTGVEIYTALFGKTDNSCVHVLNYQDQLIPKIDYAIWLSFETCPAELERILQLHPFTVAILPTHDWHVSSTSANNNWFKPETLGDSVLVFSYLDEHSNGQTIYSSLDSCHAFCMDVYD